jgi:hypothetical protein
LIVTAQEASVSRPFLADSPTPRGQAGMPDLLLAANSACTVSLPEQLPLILSDDRASALRALHVAIASFAISRVAHSPG